MTQESSIAAELRDDILRGHYRSGERLPSERDLAERFGVHRSTVRSAVKRLEQLGIAAERRVRAMTWDATAAGVLAVLRRAVIAQGVQG